MRDVLALAVSVRQTIKYRSPHWVSVDGDGDWSNRQRNVCFVSPTLYAVPLRVVVDETHDYWCHGFALHPGDTVVDVGAGIGDDVVVFSREVGLQGRVIAIEASPATYRCLVKTVRKSRLTNVTTLQVAISDHEGELVISDDLDHVANRVRADGPGDRVRGRKLDSVLAELGVPAPTLVKLNIEGAETAALRGMPETLRAAIRVVVSCHDFLADNGGDPTMRTRAEVEALLRATGRRVSGRPDDPRPWVRCYVYADPADSMPTGDYPPP